MYGHIVKVIKRAAVIFEKALQGENILVDACIGSGKTTAIQSLRNELPNTRDNTLCLIYSELIARMIYMTFLQLLTGRKSGK